MNPVRVALRTAAVGLVLLSVACGPSTDMPKIGTPSSSTATLPNPPIASRPDAASRPAAVPLGTTTGDIRSTDWARVRLPGDFCAVPGLVAFTRGEALAESTRWGPVHLFRGPEVVYGEVTGGSEPEAAVRVSCDNRGGTAAGQLAFAYVVIASDRGTLRSLGTLTTQKNPPNTGATLIGDITLAAGAVTVHESWYRPSDATCCPSGTAVTVWKVENGQLVPGPPEVTS